MFWKRRKPVWFIDPSNVAFGSVATGREGNLNRSHVRVTYRRLSDPQFLPLATFIQRCNSAIQWGQSLEIDHLLVAPLMKRRYEKFFDRLTDWGPATQRALTDGRRSRGGLTAPGGP